MHLEDHTLPCVLYHHGEIDEVVPDSIAIADSYWRIAYRYLEMVTLQTSTIPSTWRTTRFPVFCTTTGEIDEVVLDSIARADSYWRIAYRYLEMVTLVTSTLPSTWRTTRFPVLCTPREIDEVVLESISQSRLLLEHCL